jgi:hypothetical protein
MAQSFVCLVRCVEDRSCPFIVVCHFRRVFSFLLQVFDPFISLDHCLAQLAIHLLGAVENSINRNVRPGPVYCAVLRHLTNLIVTAAVRCYVVASIRCIPLRRCNAFDFCVLHLCRLQHLYR